MKLDGKTILITGSARRIGRHLALSFAQAGADIIVHHGHSPQAAAETAEEIARMGRRSWVITADLADPPQAEQLMERAWGCSPLFGLVNNAAIFESISMDETTLEAWQRHLNINLTSPFLLSQAFGRRLGKELPGKIVNIMDWRALRPGSDHFPYTISKAALAALTHSLAAAMAPQITVNALALGAILPPSDGGGAPNILADVPAQRWASLDEVSEAALFFIRGADYVTGEILHVDGGRHLV